MNVDWNKQILVCKEAFSFFLGLHELLLIRITDETNDTGYSELETILLKWKKMYSRQVRYL